MPWWILEGEGSLTNELASLRATKKMDFLELLLREEVHWRQVSQVKWAKKGDCNFNIFNRIANGRRKKKFIKSLVDENGALLGDQARILEILSSLANIIVDQMRTHGE